MKTALLSLSLSIVTSVAISQIPEAGFDNWSSSGSCDQPVGWNTVNGTTGILGLCTAQRETANPYSGSSAIKITTGQLGFPVFQTVPGIVSNGNIDIQNQGINGGIPFTDRPTAFTGWYRAAPLGNDTYSMIAVLINEATGDTVGASIFEGSATVSTWTAFNQPVQYLNQDMPTLLQISLFSSDPLNPQNGSTVYFDELGYESVTVGVADFDYADVLSYPNPTEGEIFFSIGKLNQAIVTIHNILGVKVMEQTISGINNSLDLRHLPSGTYVWQMNAVSSEVVKTGKLLLIN